MIHGRYLFWFPPRILEELRLPTKMHAAREPVILNNTAPDEGEREYLRMIARDDQTKVAGGANYFVGLANQTPTETDTLAAISSEPAVSFGYARQPIARSSIGWPTELFINGHSGVRSALVTFTASGGSFSGPISRAFLCNVVSGTAGILFSYSGALITPITLLDGESFPMAFELFLN